MAPSHLPHNINRASVSAKMAATSATQRSYFLCSAKTKLRRYQQQSREECSQHLVPVRPRFCLPTGRQCSRTPPRETCQLYRRFPLAQCQLCLEFQDSLFKGHPFRFVPFTRYMLRTELFPLRFVAQAKARSKSSRERRQ